MAHPVKAILKLRAVSAQRGGRPVLFTYEQASTAFIGLVHEAIRAVEAATGEPVKLVGPTGARCRGSCWTRLRAGRAAMSSGR